MCIHNDSGTSLKRTRSHRILSLPQRSRVCVQPAIGRPRNTPKHMYLSLCVSLICVYYSHTRSHPPSMNASPACFIACSVASKTWNWFSIAEVCSNLRQVVALESWTSGLRFANETLWQTCNAYPSTTTEVESQILHLCKGLASQLVNDTLFLCHLVADDGHLSAKAWQPHCFMLAGTTGRCDDVGTWIRFSSLLSASIWRK